MPVRPHHVLTALFSITLAICLSAGSAPGRAAAQTPGVAPSAGTLLAHNRQLRPTAMAIQVTPRYDAQGRSDSFDGQAHITLEATARATAIELHALDLAMQSASIDARPLPAPQVLAPTQRIRISFDPPLAKGRHELVLRYRGRIGQAPQGLFRIGLPEREQGPEAASGRAQILATQMEPTDARRLAPMVDEPGLRIPYRLSVTVPAGLTVVANTELVERTAAPAADPITSPTTSPTAASTASPSPPTSSGQQAPSAPGQPPASTLWPRAVDAPRVTWHFAPTPPMSSYLIGLFIGEFDQVEDSSARPALRVFTLPGKAAQGRLALDLARQLVRHYETYFDQPYPLAKLDQIALPGGFEGGMENWGAIAYHETALLFDPATSPPDRQRQVWRMVSHEVAHQWFGNLVTMAWWDDLWLNEAFATWMAARASAALSGDPSVWAATLHSRHATMGSDALASALPVIRPVDDDRAAFASFDDITYNKGMAFVQMLEASLGADEFRAGLRRYMARHRLGNTRAADLWAALDNSAARPVAPAKPATPATPATPVTTVTPVTRMAETWLRRPGLPVVSLHTRCVGGQLSVDLEQRRLVLDPALAASAQPRQAWPIPLVLGRFDAQGRLLDRHTVHLDQARQLLSLPGCDGALKLNLGAAGYYRVDYAAEALAALQAVLPRLPEADRIDLVATSWAQVQAGTLAAPRWIELVHALGDERSPSVWRAALTGLRSLDLAFEQARHPAQPAWRRHIATWLRPQLPAWPQAAAAIPPDASKALAAVAANSPGGSSRSNGSGSTGSTGSTGGTGGTDGTGGTGGIEVLGGIGTSTVAVLETDERGPAPRLRVAEPAEAAPSTAPVSSPGQVAPRGDLTTPGGAPAPGTGQGNADELREYLLAELGRIDDAPTVAAAQAVWRTLQAGVAAGRPVARLSPALVGLIGRHADRAQFDQLRRQASGETESERRSLLWHSLAGNRDATLARQAMALARGDEVPASDAPWLLEAAASAGHIDAAWAELRQHHAVLFDDLADWDRAELAPALLAAASDARLADALLAWTPGVLGSRSMPAARKAAGTIRVNAALARRAVPDLARWLATLAAAP